MRTITFILALCLTVVPAAAAEPTITAEPDGKSIDVRGLDKEVIDAVKRQAPTADQWNAAFAVRVAGKADLPTLFGTYAVADGVVRFTPRFPLALGTKYCVILDLDKLLDKPQGTTKPLVVEIMLPKRVTAPTTVAKVYPSGDLLPENLLRFYIHFSAPMSRGEAYKRIHLVDDKGKEVMAPFLELDEELWDEKGMRFTLFFDPGRIKRGLKPREELGTALLEGRSYTLQIDQGWEDANGNPLQARFSRTFKVSAPEDQRLDAKTWKLSPVDASAPLTVRFPRPLDHALLNHMIWIEDGEGKKLDGSIRIDQTETAWLFTPSKPWPAAGKRWLVVDTRLEDRAGNSIDKPFEVEGPPVKRELRTQTIRLPIP